MNMLAAYDDAMTALATALESKDVKVVKAKLDDLELIRLRAKQVRDREMLLRAAKCQVLAERHLGVLLQDLTEVGLIAAQGGSKKRKTEGDAVSVATLKEIGIDPKLSMRAKAAAALDNQAFADVIAGIETRLASGKALLVDPISASAKEAEIAGRRAAHAERAMTGGSVKDLHQLAASGFKAGFIGMDPQWLFKTRSEAGEGRSAGIHYKTEEIDKIKNLPVGALAAEHCALGMWTVDWCLEAAFALMRHYGFEPVTKLYTWVKTNGEGERGDPLDPFDDSTWHMGMGFWSRANPEDCWLATRGDPKRLYADVRQLIVAPLMEHSRKPDAWLERSERLVGGPYLELNARRTRPGWISWGDELEFTGVAA